MRKAVNDNGDTLRWRAVIEYRSQNGVIEVEHFFDEIEDLHDLVEHGPMWSCIIKITVTMQLVLPGFENLTIEEAERL